MDKPSAHKEPQGRLEQVLPLNIRRAKMSRIYNKKGIQVHAIDCLKFVPEPKRKTYKFIFADPPFNIKQDYNEFKDNRPKREYDAWTEAWIERACELLHPAGILALHGPDPLVLPYLTFPPENGLRRIAWINWHYRFGQCNTGNWIDSRCHCLIYTEANHPTWNPESVLVTSDRQSKYKDSRTKKSKTPGKRLPFTVWGVESDGPYWGRVQGNSTERNNSSPNQLPEKYIERLLLAYTDEGDSVLDMFGGSGTVPTVARALGRECTCLEISPISARSIVKRIKKGAVRVKPRT